MQSNNPTQVGAIIDAAKPCRQDISGSTYAGSFQRPAPRPITAEDIFQQYAQLVSEDGKTLDYDARTRHALETAARWLKDPSAPWCLLLTGTPGTGKTTLIQAIRAALRASGARSIPDCFTALQVAEFDETDRFRYNAICRDFSFVAIDDIGTESARLNHYGTERQPIRTALEERYSRRLRTILTTNLGPREIRARYGDRIEDRINDAAIVPYSGASYRGSR